MSDGIAWHLLQPVDVGSLTQQGFQTGMALVKGIQTKNALRGYLANPDDPQAYSALAQFDPQAANSIRDQQMQEQAFSIRQAELQRAAQEEAEAKRREAIVAGAKIIRQVNPKDDAGWQQALSIAGQLGLPLENVPREYNPEYVDAMIKTADAIAPPKENEAPSKVQEYEYAKGQGYAGTYMDFLNEQGSDYILDNGDGTKTIIPRAMVKGQQSGNAAIPPPPPGFQIVNDGGPTPSASGNFP